MEFSSVCVNYNKQKTFVLSRQHISLTYQIYQYDDAQQVV